MVLKVGLYTPRFVGKICKVNLSNTKNLAWFFLPGLINLHHAQEPLWLLKVIEDDYQVLGVHMRLSSLWKIWFTLGLFANYFSLKSCSLSLNSHKNVTLVPELFFTFLESKDVFTILSTGHGKYIIFQSLPDVCKYFSLRGYSYPRHAIILVVCPLKSLVDSHIRELRNRGISATSLSSPDVDDQNLVSRCIYHFLLQYCHSIK